MLQSSAKKKIYRKFKYSHDVKNSNVNLLMNNFTIKKKKRLTIRRD